MDEIRVAIPTTNRKIEDHLKDCSYYTIYSIKSGKILELNTTKVSQKYTNSHEIINYLSELGIHVLIAGNIPSSEIEKIESLNIKVLPYYNGSIKSCISKYLQNFSFVQKKRNVGLIDLISRVKKINH